MNYYVICKVLDLGGDELGYVVLKDGTEKLEDTNLWTLEQADELRDHVAELNHKLELQTYWPDARDPEVTALIENPDFEPLRYEETEVVDQNRVQEMVDAGQIPVVQDEDGYTIVAPGHEHLVPTRIEQVLADPSQPMERYRKASEVVAIKRAREAK